MRKLLHPLSIFFVALIPVMAMSACDREPAPRTSERSIEAAAVASSPGPTQPPQATTARPSKGGPGAPTELNVFAASSLKEAFEAVSERFERVHPDVDVVLNFAGSQVLRVQIEQGAGAHVFASADEDHMKALVQHKLVLEPTVFAENELVLIVPRTGSTRVVTFSDLVRAERLVLGAENVPVGRYTREVLARSEAEYGAGFAEKVLSRVVSFESNVRLVRAKVELGEADSAIVYRTDAVNAPAIVSIEIPGAVNVRARYPVAQVRTTPEVPAAGVFVDFLLSPEGRTLLVQAGFSAPA